jgi:aspartyl/asparaginyl beta-hydroxylase (cupin superfamily)
VTGIAAPPPATPFLDPAAYPQLATIGARWEDLRDEALAARSRMQPVDDSRSTPGAWSFLALLPEEEDRALAPEALTAANRALVPRSVELLDGVPGLLGYGFSCLAPGTAIAAHRHHQPRVTASLCLHGAAGASLEVGGEQRDYEDGEWLVFDYTRSHAVRNDGPLERLVLLVLLDRPAAVSSS